MAKLDQILQTVQGANPNCDSRVSPVLDMAKHLAAAAEAATAPADTPEPPAPETVPPAEESPAQATPEAEEAPTYTPDEVLALVQKLAAPDNPKRKRAKAIVKSYAAKVSAIPADKYAEIMDKLTALEKEG